jgi:hypothetical protein
MSEPSTLVSDGQRKVYGTGATAATDGSEVAP